MSKQRLRYGAAAGRGEPGGGEGRISPPSTDLLVEAIRAIVKDGPDEDGCLWCRVFPILPPELADAIDWCLNQ